MSTTTRLAAILDKGIQIQHPDIWEGEPPNRTKRPDFSKVSSIYLNFTPDEWWQAVTRDGDQYIGPCCGTTGAMQDILCSVHRDSGAIASRELFNLANLAQSHEGFGTFDPDMTDEQFDYFLEQWGALDLWNRVGLVYQATEPFLLPSRLETPLINRPDLKDKAAMRELEQVIRLMSWRDLFSHDHETEEQAVQRHVGHIVLEARALTPARLFLAALEEKMNDEAFEGFAIVEKGTETVVSNGYGLCFYANHLDAERMISQWRRLEKDDEEDGGPPLSTRVEIKPATVSVADGITF